MQPGATSLNSNVIRDGHPACRLKPASPAVPAASAKEENKNNNDEKCLGIHDVQPFQCDGSGLGFSTISAFARMHIIWGDAIVPASPRSASCGTLFLFAQANFDPIGRDGCSLDNVPDEAGGARAFCPGCGRVW